MNREKVEYYSVLTEGGIKEYIAAYSREAVLLNLGSPDDPKSTTRIFGYKLETLKMVTEKEARRAPYFDKFAEEYELDGDGTWILGIKNKKKRKESSQA